MKVKHYNEMMAYLTRPGFNGGGAVSNRTVLPKRKPAEEVKKRKKINYEKLKQYLGEESRELIEKELGFAIGGAVETPKRGLVDEPGSYAGKPVIKDTKYGVNIKYDTRVKKYFKRTQDGKVYQDSGETLKQFLEKNTRQALKKTTAQKKKIIEAFPEIKLKDFDDNPGYGVKKNNPIYQKVREFVERDYKIASKYRDVVLSTADQKRIQENFELPAGQEKWNFRTQSNPKGFKYGFPISADGRNDSLVKRIDRFLGKKDKITLAADRYTAKGWMMGAMERLYKQEKKSGVKIKDLTYQPKFNKEGVIIGFTDNTASGKGNTYYGLEKNERADSTSWRVHGDFRKINKFLDIANGVKADPDKVLQKILDAKGLGELGGSKRVGEKFTLTLNDILSHQRYYDVLSKTSPRALIERQIVLHHTRGIGAGSDIARAAATRDIQLLTGAINSNVEKLENIVKGTPKLKGRKLTTNEIQQLKNYGAKIVDFDGKIVGGGSVDPVKQFKSIRKDALKYAKSDQFNIETVSNYLARIGCPGKGSGGRIGFFDGGNLSKCAEKGIKKLQTTDPKNLSPADKINVKNMGKIAQGARLLKNIFGPAAIAGELVIEGGMIGNKALETGMPLKQAFGESLLNLALGPKLRVDVEAERAKEFAKGEDFAMAERGRRMAPFMARGEAAVDRRLREREEQMKQKFPGIGKKELIKNVQALYPDIDLSMYPMQDLKQQVDDLAKLEYFADNFRQEKAGGGIAKEGGVESGVAPESGPTPDGPKGLFSAIKYVKKS